MTTACPGWWSRMFSQQQLQVLFIPGSGCRMLQSCAVGSLLLSQLPGRAGVGRGVCAATEDVGPPGPVPAARPAQPAWEPRWCCCGGIVDNDGRWVSRRRAGSGLWLQTWGAKAGGGKPGITAMGSPCASFLQWPWSQPSFTEHPLPTASLPRDARYSCSALHWGRRNSLITCSS